MRRDVVVVETGIANIASMCAGLERAGATVALSDSPQTVAAASHVVLPGVGTFGAGMERLEECGLTEVLQQRIVADRPTFAVCVGLQLLFSQSEESPGVQGLAIFDGEVQRFTGPVRVPQLGWNMVVSSEGSTFVQAGYAYFANSYCATSVPDGWAAAYADHGGQFIAAIEKGSVLAAQFHPELSGQWGLGIMRRWLTAGGEGN